MRDCSQIVNNRVQGVQGVQGKKLPTLHSRRPRQPWYTGMLCRVCRVSLTGVRAHARTHTPALRTQNTLARAYMYPAHPAHPAQATRDAGFTCAGYFHAPAHPAQIIIFPKKMKKIICGDENVETFNAQLRQHVPAFRRLAGELYKAGMIKGLRGATLEFAPFDDEEETAEAKTHVCAECQHFLADQVGDGTGIGDCAIGGHRNKLKWPNQNACRQFDELTGD